jgi:hypothetical protein
MGKIKIGLLVLAAGAAMLPVIVAMLALLAALLVLSLPVWIAVWKWRRA